MSDFKVIILTHDTLHAIGLKSIFSDAFGINAFIASEHYIDSFNATREPHLFFVDAATLVSNLAFFLPRKAKTIIITHDHTASDEFATLCVNDTESDIISAINTNLSCEHQQEHPDFTSSLSQRETEVLRLIASGKINKEIAQHLNISINTVLSHRKNITAKLGIKSISGLTFYAMMNGIA